MVDMSKLKLCVLVPALYSGPGNSLSPSQQLEKERKFLTVVDSSTSIGALYNILHEKYQETYLDDQLRRCVCSNLCVLACLLTVLQGFLDRKATG